MRNLQVGDRVRVWQPENNTCVGHWVEATLTGTWRDSGDSGNCWSIDRSIATESVCDDTDHDHWSEVCDDDQWNQSTDGVWEVVVNWD